MIPDSVVVEVGGVDRIAALARRVSSVIEWKVAQEARAEARFHQRRRQARRRRRARVARRRVLLSRLSSWAR